MNIDLVNSQSDREYVVDRVAGTCLDGKGADIFLWDHECVHLYGTFSPEELELIADIMRTLPSQRSVDPQPPGCGKGSGFTQEELDAIVRPLVDSPCK